MLATLTVLALSQRPLRARADHEAECLLPRSCGFCFWPEAPRPRPATVGQDQPFGAEAAFALDERFTEPRKYDT
jgi:hypothetical protein